MPALVKERIIPKHDEGTYHELATLICRHKNWKETPENLGKAMGLLAEEHLESLVPNPTTARVTPEVKKMLTFFAGDPVKGLPSFFFRSKGVSGLSVSQMRSLSLQFESTLMHLVYLYLKAVFGLEPDQFAYPAGGDPDEMARVEARRYFRETIMSVIGKSLEVAFETTEKEIQDVVSQDLRWEKASLAEVKDPKRHREFVARLLSRLDQVFQRARRPLTQAAKVPKAPQAE